MAPIAADDLLGVWIQGRERHPVDQALTLLAVAEPGTPAARLAALSVGERDARLVALREEFFGPRLQSLATCPHCDERVEFTLSTDDLREPALAGPPASELQLAAGAGRLSFRPPNSYDLAAIAHCGDPDQARSLLAARCLIDGDAAALSDGIIAELAERLVQNDPRAEVLLDLACPGCGHAWQLIFDIASFLWAEVVAEARRLLRQVDALARAYGWREADILAMSPVRRQLYVEMAG